MKVLFPDLGLRVFIIIIIMMLSKLWGGGGSSEPKKKKQKLQNIFTFLEENAYGEFKRLTMKETDLFRQKKLPRVVVLGLQDAGCSSLVTSITNIELFDPICTKRPIRLVMNPKFTNEVMIIAGEERLFMGRTEVQATIQGLMENENIRDEEIVIMVGHAHEHEHGHEHEHEHGQLDSRLEIIDLPGIREFPLEEKLVSHQIARNYINDPNYETFVIVCVPATTSGRLTGNQAIGLIMELGKQSNAIICLTMSEHVSASGVERIIGRTQEIEKEKWAGIVVNTNRNPSGVIDCLGSLYKRYICKEWVPDAVTILGQQIDQVKDELTLLGPPPCDLRVQDVVNDIIRAVDCHGIYSKDLLKGIPQIDRLPSRDWAELEQLVRVVSNLKDNKDVLVDQAIERLQGRLSHLLLAACGTSCGPNRVNRFVGLHTILNDQLLREESYDDLANDLTALLREISRPDKAEVYTKETFCYTIRVNLAVAGVNLIHSLHVGPEVVLEESVEVAQARVELEAKIQDLTAKKAALLDSFQ